MGKASIDDCLTDHPKFDGINGEAGWFWLAGLLYARRSLTDGFIPSSRLVSLVHGQRSPAKLAEVLVTRGLWERVTGGFQIHDFFDHNPSKAQVRAYQQKDRERKQSRYGIRAESRSDSDVESRSDSERRGVSHAGAKSESESESKSASEALRGKGVGKPHTAVVPIDPQRGNMRQILAQEAKHRFCPPFTWEACARGVCVPARLHAEWMRQLGADSTDWQQSEREIGAMVDAALAPVIGAPGDAWDFWRGVWRAAHPSQAPAPAPRPAPESRAVVSGRDLLIERARERGEVV